MFRVFRHYIPKTLLILGAAESLILFVSVYLGVTFRFFDWDFNNAYSDASLDGSVFSRAAIFSLVMICVMTALGLYQHDLRDGPRELLLRLGLSFVSGFMLMTLVFSAFPDLFLGRGAFGIAFLIAFLGILSCRFLCIQSTDSAMKRRVLVLGVGRKAQLIESLRRASDHRGVSIIGYLDVGGGPMLVDERKVIRIGSSLQEFVRDRAVDEIVLAVDDRRKKVPIDAILECKMRGVHIIDVMKFHERQLGMIKLDSLHPSNLVFCDGFYTALLNSASKRVFDIVVSAVLLLIALPVMAVTAIAILVESRGKGPVFYKQTRVGKDKRPFGVLKFRSMAVDAEQDGVARWAQANDGRVTAIGRLIRRARIDELPQLLNVLKGDMSFVGPRPERPEFVRELTKTIPYYEMRHHIKPGITGWAQICYPYGASESDAREKLQYDLYYLKNYSLFLDLTILIQTVQVILWAKGAR